MFKVLEEFGELIYDNSILLSIKNDEDFDLILDTLGKDNTEQVEHTKGDSSGKKEK